MSTSGKTITGVEATVNSQGHLLLTAISDWQAKDPNQPAQNPDAGATTTVAWIVDTQAG